jgi:tRNA A-37 threonylcarbamoyl transferase component Bud32
LKSRVSLRQHYIRATKDVLLTLVKSGLWFHCSPKLQAGERIKNDFFGINIAPSSDPRADDYIVERLRELDLQNVRMDFTYASLDGDAERLLQRVLAEGFKVMLDLLPPFEDAVVLADDNAAQNRWREFVATVANQYGTQVNSFEIGATPNRGRWSGFEPLSYLVAWEIASKQLAGKDIVLAGPNVSDFEPISNVILLAEMQRQGTAPDIHTDNLFVERVIEPEAYDHRVFGRWMTNIFKFNLVKKARIYANLTQRFGAKRTVCSYKCWTTKRLSRFSDTPDIRKANYLVRYLVIAASSGALDKVYWGPLICSRDGLITDGAEGYPKIDNVSFYKEIRGKYEQFQPEKAYYALQNLINLLSGAECVQAVSADHGINHFIFNTEQNTQLHIGWTRDRQIFPLLSLYTQQQIDEATFIDICGETLNHQAISFSEQPLFLQFSAPQATKINVEQIERLVISKDVVFPYVDDVEFTPWSEGDWNGAIGVKTGENLLEKVSAMLPESLLGLPQLGVHRDQRNKVWSIKNPLNPDETLVVKQNRVQGLKKFSYRFKASKGERHWNNASEMIRRGVSSPTPIAYFERTKNAAITHNYYVCEFVADAFSARDAFVEFAQGEEQYAGFDKGTIYRAIAHYTCKMHNNQIIHYDLSGGNLLMTKNDHGQIDVTAIDIGRAAIFKGKKITEKMRLIDLRRICYKLDWPNREIFMQAYFDEYGKAFGPGWRKPLENYEWKQRTKRKIKLALNRMRGKR